MEEQSYDKMEEQSYEQTKKRLNKANIDLAELESINSNSEYYHSMLKLRKKENEKDIKILKGILKEFTEIDKEIENDKDLLIQRNNDINVVTKMIQHFNIIKDRLDLLD